MEAKRGARAAPPQQVFLNDAMARLGLGVDGFAARLGSNPERVARWLAPLDAPEFQEMEPDVWKLVRDILRTEAAERRPRP